MHYYGSLVISPPPCGSVRIPPVKRKVLHLQATIKLRSISIHAGFLFRLHVALLIKNHHESYRPRPAMVPSSLASEVMCGKEELSSEVGSTELLLTAGCGLLSPSTTDTGETVEASVSLTLVWGFTWFLLKNTSMCKKQLHQVTVQI